jgi:hypothetical protein
LNPKKQKRSAKGSKVSGNGCLKGCIFSNVSSLRDDFLQGVTGFLSDGHAASPTFFLKMNPENQLWTKAMRKKE